MSPESFEAIQAIARAHNQRRIPIIDRDEEMEGREEDASELSDLEYHGQHERFTCR